MQRKWSIGAAKLQATTRWKQRAIFATSGGPKFDSSDEKDLSADLLHGVPVFVLVWAFP